MQSQLHKYRIHLFTDRGTLKSQFSYHEFGMPSPAAIELFVKDDQFVKWAQQNNATVTRAEIVNADTGEVQASWPVGNP